MSHGWTRVGNHALARGTRSTRGTPELLRVIGGMGLLLVPRDVVTHIGGSIRWQHRTIHGPHVLVTLHLNHALPRLLGLLDATLS